MPVYKDETKGTWYVNTSYTNVFGKRVYIKKRGFKSKTIALQYERQKLVKVQNIKKQPMRFDELFKSYLDHKSSRLKPRSIFDYNSIYQKHIKPYFGDMFIDKIKIPHIEIWRKKTTN